MEIIIDIETRSGYDLKEVGLHKYTESPEFEILLVGFKIDNEPTRVLDLVNSKEDKLFFFDKLVNEMTRPDSTLIAFNVDFELACLSRILPAEFKNSKEKWLDIQTYALMLGLPASLSKVLGTLHMKGKDTAGTLLINKFSKPNGKWFRVPQKNMPLDVQQEWLSFIKYCENDVDVEYELYHRLASYMKVWPVTDFERSTDMLSHKINCRGVKINVDFTSWLNTVYNTILVDLQIKLAELTGLANPNSPIQFSKWLRDNGINVAAVDKTTLSKIATTNETVKKALLYKLAMSSSIPKKYAAGLNYAMLDGRMRGLFKYYGANRTGRWSSSGYQLHNLARTNNDLAMFMYGLWDDAPFMQMSDVMSSIYKKADELDISVSVLLGQCVRSIIEPKVGHMFFIADFSAIEARVAAWLANEEWVLEVFASDGLIYERTAAKMFNVSIEEASATAIRQKGKYAVLSLGYGGGVQALCNFGADKVMTYEEMDELVTAWRTANPSIVAMWGKLETGFRRAFDMPNSLVKVSNNVAFHYNTEADVMHMILPSGRALSYFNPSVNRREIKYMNTSNGFSGVYDTTYGGKLFENLCQAVARDFLAYFMLNLDDAGLDIVLHVHDEAVVEYTVDGAEDANNIIALIKSIGSMNPAWGQGIPLAVSVEVADWYKK